MSNSTPTQRAWYLLGQAEDSLIKQNFPAMQRYTDLANAYFQIIDAEESEALNTWITVATHAADTSLLTIDFQAMTVTGATAPTDAQVLWNFGVGEAVPAVTNKALTSNVATLTTATAHGLITGQLINVAGVDSTLNSVTTAGSQDCFTITGTPTATTLTYAKTTTNISTIACSGTITVAGVAPYHKFAASGSKTVTVSVFAASLTLAATAARTFPVPFVS